MKDPYLKKKIFKIIYTWKILLIQITSIEKEFRKILKQKKSGEYHELYAQSDTLLLTDIFKNFRDKCLKIYEIDSARFTTATTLLWQAALKKSKVKLHLLTDTVMLLMLEKCIRGEICHAIQRYEKDNNKYIKDYHENIESSYLKYRDVNNLYGWKLSNICL